MFVGFGKLARANGVPLVFVRSRDCPIDTAVACVSFRRCSKWRVIGCHFERKVQGDSRFCTEYEESGKAAYEVRMPRDNLKDGELKGTASRLKDRHPVTAKKQKACPADHRNACRLEPPLQYCISAGVRRYDGGRTRERPYVH